MNKQDLEHLMTSGCSICRDIAEREYVDVAGALSHGFDGGFNAGVEFMVEWVNQNARRTYDRGFGELTIDRKGWESQIAEAKKIGQKKK